MTIDTASKMSFSISKKWCSWYQKGDKKIPRCSIRALTVVIHQTKRHGPYDTTKINLNVNIHYNLFFNSFKLYFF